MDSNTDNSIDVTIAAIDDGYIVLESIEENKIHFKWPLHKIPRPLEIGSKLKLTLAKTDLSSSCSPIDHLTTIEKPIKTNKQTKIASQNNKKTLDSDAMRKLLEELVN